MGFDARHQFAHGERLGQIIICAHFETHDAIYLIIAGGEHQNRCGHLLAQDARHFEAIQFGEHDVEQDEIGFELPGGIKRGASITDGFDGEAILFEIVGECFSQSEFVFDD